MLFQIPEGAFVVNGLTPQIGAGAPLVADYISLKNAQMCYVIFQYNQGDGAAITFDVMRSTVVASGRVELANAVPIWSNLDCATSDTLVRRADAVNYAAGTGATQKLIVMQIDPARLGGAYDCISAGTVTNVAAVVNWLSILYVIVPKYASAVVDQTTFITD